MPQISPQIQIGQMYISAEYFEPALSFIGQVFLKCAEENKLRSVKEPHICKYELVLATPLACPLDSLLGEWFLASLEKK